jgi:aarF domain-containing kinase
MEFIDGVHLDEKAKLQKMGINTKKIGALFSQMIIKMIHKAGFVHADTHCGNLMARKMKGRDQLVIIDHGLYQDLDRNLQRNYN